MSELRQFWQTSWLYDQVNHHERCSSIATTLACRVNAHPHPLSLRELRQLLSGVDLLIAGNSVARNVYFTFKGLLELAQEHHARTDLSWPKAHPKMSLTTTVTSTAISMNTSHVYRTTEKAMCAPRSAAFSCSSTVGSTHLFSYWIPLESQGNLPLRVLQEARQRAGNQSRKLKVVIYDPVASDVLGNFSDARILASARDYVSHIIRLGAIHNSIFWLPAPRLCDAPSTQLREFFRLPDRSMEGINDRIALRNRWIGCALKGIHRRAPSAAMPPTPIIHVLDNSLDPVAGSVNSSIERECLCYDDYIHHSRLSFLAIVHIAHAILAKNNILAHAHRHACAEPQLHGNACSAGGAPATNSSPRADFRRRREKEVRLLGE
eukprot:CAMPEP_0183365446 /NCGR_PEP_ID=MMETSP0164_2-20130417/84810_1 /TAXON_ID=221442 /ORGANISM="Coccolithus pelagicus ssp braarudi, Strain PLY182g" /LENGTH=377 /DNA_ID=CAMNT_0025540983 /DNA_START=41 /DNA_END=1174 /DNA_ORIENTATION=+